MTKSFRTAGLLLLAAAIAAPVMAQTLTGSISGTIKDEQGAVLPGVTVTLDRQAGHSDTGDRSQRQLSLPRRSRSGTYEVSAELSGFSKGDAGERADFTWPRTRVSICK